MTTPVQGMNVAITVTQDGAQAAIQQVRGLGIEIERFGNAFETSTTSVRKASNALPSFYEGVEQGGLKAAGAERGIRRMEFALSTMTAEALFAKRGIEGLADASLRLGESAILFAGGSQAVLGVGGALAAAAVSYKLLSAGATEAMEANDKLAESFQKLEAKGRPLVAVGDQIVGVETKISEIMERLAAFQGLTETPMVPRGVVPAGTDAGFWSRIGAGIKTAAGYGDQEVSALLTELATARNLLGGLQTEQRQAIGAQTVKDAQRGMETAFAAGRPEAAVDSARQARVGLKFIRGLTAEDIAKDAEEIGKTLARGYSDAIRRAGENADLEGAQRLFREGVAGIQGLGLAPVIGGDFINQMQEATLRATELNDKAFGPTPLDLSARVRAESLGLTSNRPTFTAPFIGTFQPTPFPLGAPAAPSLGTTSPAITSGTGAVNISAVGNLKAMDDGARAAAHFAEEANKAANKIEIAGEKLSVSLTRDVGNAIILALRGRSVSGLFAGASSVTGTLAQQRFTDADEQASHGANVSGSLKFPGLGMASTVLSLVGGVTSLFGSLFSSGISIKDYGPVALEQLRALMVQGGLVSMNITSANGLSSSEAQNLINRNSSRDSIPRFPAQPAGAGR